MKIKKNLTFRLMLGVGLIIVCMSGIGLACSIIQYQNQAEAEMKEKAAVIAQQLLATRAFIAQNQDLINYDQNGNFHFKHLNPAAVGRGLSYIFKQNTGYWMKQTRLNARVSGNEPDAFEAAKLTYLSANPEVKEIWGYDVVEKERVFRYLFPLKYEQDCLTCHGDPKGEIDISGFPKEGGRIGEFAGALSIVFPTQILENNIKNNILLQLLFAIAILIPAIYMVYRIMDKIVIIPVKALTQKISELGDSGWEVSIDPELSYDEIRKLGVAFNAMAERIQNSHALLEEQVEDRTSMLKDANRLLAEQSKELSKMNARLSETDRLKSEFLAVMSHELRTPLTAIIAFSETLLGERRELSALQSEFLNDILESARSMHMQINDILDISKIEAGLMKLCSKEVDIRDLLDEIARTMGHLFEKKGIQFSIFIHSETPSLEADFDKLKRIMENLLSNAVKFTPEKGTVTVSVNPCQSTGIDQLQIVVKDSGIGIEAEDIPYIFDRFRQSGSGGENSGSGLGLSIVQSLVALHGGNISVDSIPQKGTAFIIHLPICQKKELLEP
ncbi:MAG: ATP-binding protein [Clostridiales bacterium]|nr:ATP-binding protein [Clostridiales bacterium]MDR2713387.1 DUF3365 domain-containing protein [Clostridiales bacterium]